MHVASQLRSIASTVFIAGTLAMTVFGLVVLAGQLYDIPIHHFTADPNATLRAPFYIGFISNLGIMLWAAATALCIFSAFLLRNSAKPQPLSGFLFYSGLFTGLLMLDDVFLLHEEVFPKHLGIAEELVYASYGLFTILLLVLFRRTILKTEYLLWGLAFGLLGASVVVDLMPFQLRHSFLVEDGLKFFGIVFWLAYFVRVCFHALRPVPRAQPSVPLHASVA